MGPCSVLSRINAARGVSPSATFASVRIVPYFRGVDDRLLSLASGDQISYPEWFETAGLRVYMARTATSCGVTSTEMRLNA